MEDWGWRTMWVLSPRQLLMVSHSLTTDLLPLLSASIFTSEKILFDVWWSSIKYRSQGSGKNQLTLHQRQGQSGSQSRSWDLLEKLALYALPRHYVAESYICILYIYRSCVSFLCWVSERGLVSALVKPIETIWNVTPEEKLTLCLFENVWSWIFI